MGKDLVSLFKVLPSHSPMVSEALKALETIGQRGLNDYGVATVASVFDEEYDSIKKAIAYLEEELRIAKQSYKALEEHFFNSVAYGTKIQDELNAYKEKDKRLKEIADKCVEYIRKNKPVSVWAGTIKRLENAQYAQFISDTVFMYSNGGALYDYADQMVKELDK